MQLKLTEDLSEQKDKLRKEKQEEERLQRKREEKERYFEENFKHGSTTVIKRNDEFYFKGDISHCGKDNIFHNAMKIKELMQDNGQTRGHMSYDDPPDFDSKWDWEKEEKDRKKIYEEDLYKFVGDEVVIVDLIYEEPQTQIYCLDEE